MAPLRGYVNLNVLVRRHPGWPGVLQYDEMLGRLARASRQARADAARPIPALTLPGQVGLELPGEAFTLPASALEQERRQLAAQQSAQMDRLRRRRAQAREQQIAVQLRGWREEAQFRYGQAIQAAQALYAQRFQDAFTADGATRLNLGLQILALKQSVADWKSSEPPTPRLDQARKDLAARQERLAGLNAQQASALAALRRERDAALEQARADRRAFVVGQRARLAAALEAQDEAALIAQRALIARQTTALLRQQRTLAAAPAGGALPAVSLPPVAAEAAATSQVLKTATVRLRTQRARWIKFLYDDTEAAAQDAARQRGWKITFGPSQRGEPDLTSPLAELMAGRVWKS